MLNTTSSKSLTSWSIKGIFTFDGHRPTDLTIYRPFNSFKSFSSFCTSIISPSLRFPSLCFEVFAFNLCFFSECSSLDYDFSLSRFAAQGPPSSLLFFQFAVSTDSFPSQLDFVQISAGITLILTEVPVFRFRTSTNVARLPDPQRPRSTQTPRSSRVTSASRKSPASPSTILVRRPTIAPSKTSSGKASTEGQALCYGCRSRLVSRNLPLLTHRARYSPKTRTSPNPAASPLVRVILLILLAANPSLAQLLLLATNNTQRLRRIDPRHYLKHLLPTAPTTSRLPRYCLNFQSTKQNRLRAPSASQRLRERHPSSTSITSHLSQKRVTYPNDERVRNTATRRAADKVKRHVPDYSRVYNGELTSETLQPCRLRSAMWHLHSQPCVRSGIDLSSASTSCNMRHSLTNQLTQVISNSNTPCLGPENSVAFFVYFPDSDSLLGFNSILFSPLDFLYMRLLVSPRHDESVLISNMQFPTSSSLLPMPFIYAFKITSLFHLFCLQLFDSSYENSISYFRTKSQRHAKNLFNCWSPCLKTKFQLKVFNSKSFQNKDFDSKPRINRVGKSSLDLRFAKIKLFGHFNSTTTSHGFKPITFPAETEGALMFKCRQIMPHDFKSIVFPAEGRSGLINSPVPYVHIIRTWEKPRATSKSENYRLLRLPNLPNINSWLVSLLIPTLLTSIPDPVMDLEVQFLTTHPYKAEDDDEFIFYPNQDLETSITPPQFAFTAYKRVDKKIHPVSTQFPQDCRVTRQVPEDPLLTLTPLTQHPPRFEPTKKISVERMKLLNVNATGFLWPEEEMLFEHIMKLNEDAIAFEDIERGTLKESYFSPYIIPTVPHVPWEHTNRSIPAGLLDKILEVLKLKMKANVYEHSQSSYRSRWFVVLKKNGKLRIVHDLQPLNKVSIRDAGMLPIVDNFVEGFAGRQCYTVFDLFWGFDARKIHPKSRDLTAFMTPLGLLQITSLPTGFTNSPAEFQKCMTIVLQDEIPHTANIFVDDLPIKGPVTQYLDENGNPETLSENPGIRKFIWEHATAVHRVMHRVNCSGATFAANKAQICLPDVLIIGQRCNAKGREPDTNKIDKILTWPPLKTPKEVRRFLGLCGGVRVWIQNYSLIVRPLTELYRKGIEFIWDDRRQAAFDKIKELITTAPALRPIDYTSDNPVILSVDSSQEAAGMILSQIDDEGRRRIARYGSVPMSERESRYSQPKLELFGLYRALRHWRLYIIGIKNLHVEVDAMYIKGMLNEPDLQPNAAINRWIQGILMFDFTLVHVPADRHKGPDALSRRPPTDDKPIQSHDDSWLDNIALQTHFPSLHTDPFSKCYITPYHNTPDQTLPEAICLAARAPQERMLTHIQHFLETLETPVFDNVQKKRRFLAKAVEFISKDKRLFKKNGDRPPLLVVFSPEQKLSILTQAHDGTGHRGVQSVFELIRHRFYWPHLRADVNHHVRSCHECQIRSLKRTEIPLTISAPTTLFTKIYIDIMHMPESIDKYKYIVAARDDLSGTCEAQALQKATSAELAQFFWIADMERPTRL
jgi:hypothetical protein